MRVATTWGPKVATAVRTLATHRRGSGPSKRSWNKGTIWVSSSSNSELASTSSRLSGSSRDSADAMAHPSRPSNISSHQPSRIEQFNPPFSAAFMPLVPHASWGRRGVFSHTSAPWYRKRATAMS